MGKRIYSQIIEKKGVVMGRTSKNIVGCKFEKLTVISFAGYNQNRKSKEEMYLCQCDCGNTTVANKDALLKGETKSCGCIRGKNNYINLTGMKFGKLTVIERLSNQKGYVVYKCVCECGKYRNARAEDLKSGIATDCKKYKLEHHGLCKSRLYWVWHSMKDRCYNPKATSYKHYGGRGIKVCDEWKNSFKTFYDWSYSNGYDENAPRNKCTIDRINNDGDYEPSNCRWVDAKIQASNQRKRNIKK